MPRQKRLGGVRGLICGLVALAGLACGALGADAATEPSLQFALIVSGGMDGETATKLFVYDDGLVIRLGEAGPHYRPIETRFLSSKLDRATHDALVAQVRDNLKQGRLCDSGPSVIDGFAARLYEIGPGDPPAVALYRLSLGRPTSKQGACAALTAGYEALAALRQLPAQRWRPGQTAKPGEIRDRRRLPGEELLPTAIPANR